MDVQQLIDQLLQIEDKSKKVKVEQPAATFVAIEEITEGTKNVYINI